MRPPTPPPAMATLRGLPGRAGRLSSSYSAKAPDATSDRVSDMWRDDVWRMLLLTVWGMGWFWVCGDTWVKDFVTLEGAKADADATKKRLDGRNFMVMVVN